MSLRRHRIIGLIVSQQLLVFPTLFFVSAFGQQMFGQQMEIYNEVIERPIEVLSDGYVGSGTCGGCHSRNHETWYASYHRTMTQVASPETVIGDFGSVRLDHGGRTYRLERDKEGFWVEIDSSEPSPERQPSRQRHQIALTTGSHHMQVYWYPIGGRALEIVPFIYLKNEKRWIPRHAGFLKPRPLVPLVETGRWNRVCIDCHTTHGQMRIFFSDSRKKYLFDSQAAEFGISCEACHGPGQDHVQAKQPDRRKTIVHPARLSHKLSAAVCGRCHSVRIEKSVKEFENWNAHGCRFRPGNELSNADCMVVQPGQEHSSGRLKEVLRNDPQFFDRYFWSDGMVRVSGREYNGLLQTACFQRGEMSCLSCHQLHLPADDPRTLQEWTDDQLKLLADPRRPEMDGNPACVQCHTQFEDKIRLTRHTHHAAGSSGSSCYNCHMSHTTYGLLKAIRSHQIDSPGVAISLQTDRPNACNQCHLDKTMAWAADHLRDWYGIAKPDLSGDQNRVAASVLWSLRGDAGQRALMAWSYGWEAARKVSGTGWMAPYLAQLLEDPYPAVRFIAARSLRMLPEFDGVAYDFVGPSRHRSQARTQVMEAWRRRSDKPAAAHLLIDSSGVFNQREFERLLKQRDNRKVVLSE